MGIQYRLYTENRDNIPEIAVRYFESFTVFHGTGYYLGTPEHSTMIEIVLEVENRSRIEALASDINTLNNQGCVLITEQPITASLHTKRTKSLTVVSRE